MVIEDAALLREINMMDWECAEADTQYLTHSIHRYSGKFIPQIGKQAISLLSQPGDLVLDPYCGSGTVLLECSLARRRSIGIDLNPIAVLISKVKTTPVNKNDLESFVESMEVLVNPLLRKPRLDRYGELQSSYEESILKDQRWNNPWYRKWFQDNVLAELIAIHKHILSHRDEKYRNIGLVAFSDILRKCSNANPTYPNVMFDKGRGPASSATPEFIKKLRQVADSVSQLETCLAGMPIPEVVCGKAQSTELHESSVDAIVTHPPYIGSIPYAEYGLLSLVWLGYDPKALDGQLTGGKRQSSTVVQRFELEFKDMFKESWRVLKPARYAFMLLGNPTIRGKQVNLVEMAKTMAVSSGFRLAAEKERRGINRRANLMSYETLLFFRKN